MPEIRSVRYQDAIDWLKAVGSGEISANLPLIKNQDGQHLIGVKIQSKYKASSNKW